MDGTGGNPLRTQAGTPIHSPYPAASRKKTPARKGGSAASSRTASPANSERARALISSAESKCGDSEPILLVEDDEEMDPSTPEKRGPSRPTTTGDYYVKQEADRLARVRDEAEMTRKIMNPAVPFEDKSGKISKLAQDIEEKLAEAPENDIFSRFLQEVNAILKVARLSKNLKGEFRGLLNRTIVCA